MSVSSCSSSPLFRMQEMREKAVEKCYPLQFIPAHLKTQGMYNKAVNHGLWQLEYIPDCFETSEMCNEAVQEYPCLLMCVPDRFKTERMC